MLRRRVLLEMLTARTGCYRPGPFRAIFGGRDTRDPMFHASVIRDTRSLSVVIDLQRHRGVIRGAIVRPRHYTIEIAPRQHAAITRRFHRVIDEHAEKDALRAGALQGDRGVGADTELLFQEHLGKGPKRYQFLRQMHLARQALPERFSRYDGHRPSATLARPH